MTATAYPHPSPAGTPVVSADEMAALDQKTIERLGIPGGLLMENAGRGIVEHILRLERDGCFDLSPGVAEVVVVAGPGNNGGDGYVVARYLHARGVRVRVLLCAERERVRGDALLHLNAAEAFDVAVRVTAGAVGAGEVAAVLGALSGRDVIVDALFGIGLKEAVRGSFAQVIAAINDSPAVRIAVDVPSGLDADRGLPVGSPAAGGPIIVRADHTVTMALPKLGLVGAPGFSFAGRLAVVDIGIPPALVEALAPRARLLDAHCLARLAATRSPLGHKGTHGHLLVIAGSRGKTGAALLAVRAALRVGVGLLTLAAPEEVVDSALHAAAPEAMSLPYSLADSGLSSAVSAAARGKQALAIGPGIPPTEALRRTLHALLDEVGAAMVLDADALNLLTRPEDLERLREACLGTARRAIVLTPHPGEAARLLHCTVPEVQADRIRSAERLCAATGAVVVLKGARTVVATGSSAADVRLALCPTGNAGMGVGGMGDVLTGIIGALLCAGLPAYEAACAGVYLHGLAGDLLAERRPPGALLLPSEVIDSLDEARRAADEARRHPSGLFAGWPTVTLP